MNLNSVGPSWACECMILEIVHTDILRIITSLVVTPFWLEYAFESSLFLPECDTTQPKWH